MPETPLQQTTPTPPLTPEPSPNTRPLLRAHSSPSANLDSAVRYTEIQEHEAAARQLRRQSWSSPKPSTATQPTQPKQRKGRKRLASRSLSATLASAVTEQLQTLPEQPPRPLQKRKTDGSPSFIDVAQHGRLYDHINGGNRQQWIATCSHILRRYQLASIAEDSADKTDAFADLLLLPGQVLAKLNRGGQAIKPPRPPHPNHCDQTTPRTAPQRTSTRRGTLTCPHHFTTQPFSSSH